MSTTEGMKGGGYYDDHSEYQQKVAATGADLVRNAIATMPPLPAGASFVIADYGCSTGKGSLTSMRTAVDAIRAAEPDRPIAAIHNDVPTNDWNTLFANVAASGPNGYADAAGPTVVALASAVSFFDAATPAGLVNLGVSYSAAHWLQTQPDVTVDGFYFCEASGAAREQLAQQADADWTQFLEMRAEDLAKGAHLIVQMVGTDTSEPGTPKVTARALLQAMAEVASQMADDGLLERAAVDRYVLPVVARTVDEARHPFEVEGSVVASSFTADVVRTDPVANPYLDQWRRDHDDDAYGRSYAAFVRGFTESSIRDNLVTPGAKGASVDVVLDGYYDRLRRRFTADPEADAFEDWTLTVVATRTGTVAD